MSITLTPEQNAKIIQDRKGASELPAIYRQESDQAVPISRVFEASLILLDESTRKEAISWLKKIIGLTSGSADRDALAQEFIQNRQSDNAAIADALNDIFGGFEDFRKRFTSSPLSPEETDEMFSDINTVIGPLRNELSVQNHLASLLAILKARLELSSTKENA